MTEKQARNKAIAEKLADMLNDHENVGFYYKLAEQNNHSKLLETAYWVSDYPNPRHKGRLFTWKLKNDQMAKEISDIDGEDNEQIFDYRDISKSLADLKSF